MKIFSKFFPIFLCLIIVFVFYKPFFINKLVPIPADIITGVYFPWLDSKYDIYPAGVPVKNPLPSDVVSLTYPERLLSISLIKNHQWPLWNSQILSGTPLLANFQSAALYPLNFLLLLFKNFSYGWSVQIISQYILGFLFMYLFLRAHKISQISSCFGSLIWAFSGFFSIWGQYNTVIHSILFLPLALFSVKKIKDYPFMGILLSLSVAFSIYAGNPPISLILIATTFFYAIFEYQKNIKYYIYFSIFFSLGILLTSPLLLLGNIALNNSIRDIDTVAQQANIKFLPVFKIISLLAPDFFGHPSTMNTWVNTPLYDNSTIYAGIIPLILFFYTFSIKNKSKLLKLSQFLFFIVLLLIIKNPISNFIFNLPVLGLSAMVATRLSVLLNFSIAICGSIALDSILAKKINFKFAKNIIKWFFIILAFYLAYALIINLFFRYFPNSLGVFHISFNPSLISQMVKETTTSLRNTAIPILLILSSISIFFVFFKLNLFQKKPYFKYIFISLIFIITLADLFRFFRKYNTFTYSQFLYPDTQLTDYLKNNSIRFARENAEIIPSNMWMPYNLLSASGFDTLHSLRYNHFLSLVNNNNLSKVSSRFAEIDEFNSPLINFLGISHIVAVKKVDFVPDINGTIQDRFDQKKFPIIYDHSRTVILKNPRVLPLLYPVSDYQTANNIEKTQELLLSSDLSKTVIIEGENLPVNKPIKLPQIFNLKLESQQTTLNTSSSEPSLLVTSQSFDPGWNLFIDNLPSKILKANYAFMAFIVPTGDHNIKLIYQPKLFYTALKITAASGSFLLLITVFLFFFRKRIYHKL